MTKAKHDRRTLCLYFAGLAVLGGGLWGIRDTAFPTRKPEPGWYGKVTRVLDGDTLEASNGKEKKTIRLAGVDAPEKSQPFGPESRAWLERESQGQEVRVVESGRDRYGRTIGAVFLGRRWFNRELVARGFAMHYAAYSNDPGLAAAEQEARAARRGLWADDEPIPPWDWRKQDHKEPTE